MTAFLKNAVVFETKRGRVLKKRREILLCRKKCAGVVTSTISFELIYNELSH